MHSIHSLILDARPDAKLTAQGNEYRISCPSPEHDDTNPSCYINATSGAWHCKSCNARGSLKTFLLHTLNVTEDEAKKMSKEAKGGLLGKPQKTKKEIITSAQLPPTNSYIAKYEYKDSRGYCYAVVYRKKNIKALPYTHVGDGQWVMEAPKTRYPYMAERLRGKHLIVVEGEKCAEAAFGVIGGFFDVVTWMGGTNSAHLTDWTALHGLTVYLWPDNDKAGQTPMNYIKGQLANQGCKVYVLKIPEGLPEKWDVADAVEAWGSDAQEKIGRFILDNRVEYEPNPYQPVEKAPVEEEYDQGLEDEFAKEEDPAILNKTSPGLRQALNILRFQYRYNTRSQQHEVRRTDDKGKLYKAWYKKINYPPGWITVDDHIRALLIDLIERSFKLPNGKPMDLSNKFDDLFLAVTVDRQVDDFKEWLDELPPWDGDYRIGMVAFDILGAYPNTSADEAITLIQHMSSGLFIAPIQRTMEPGCTIDEIPVLLGPGEIGKTKFYSYVFPEECQHWYAGPIDFSKDSRKELIEMTNGPVVVEVGEMRLSTLNETQIARMKDFITRGSDRIRLAYGRRAVTINRRFSLIATANKKSTGTFYYDVDGHRRFLVVDVAGCSQGPAKAIAYLKNNRLQLWAEALHMYKEGKRANIPHELRYWQKEMAEQHVEIDEAYDGKIADLESRIRNGGWLSYSDDFGTDLYDVGKQLEFNVDDPAKFDRANQRRLSVALTRRGWTRKQKRAPDGSRPYFWFAPEVLKKVETTDE